MRRLLQYGASPYSSHAAIAQRVGNTAVLHLIISFTQYTCVRIPERTRVAGCTIMMGENVNYNARLLIDPYKEA